MQTIIKPEIQKEARQIYEQYKEIIDMDARDNSAATMCQRAVARTIRQLAGLTPYSDSPNH
jgi:hypothetical protein